MIKEGTRVTLIGQEFYGKEAKVLYVNKEFGNAMVYGEDFRYLADIKELEEIDY